MALKKNQHYVPKFYLKFFSINNNDINIGLFQISKKMYIGSVPLKHQAKEDYFYGEDGVLEEKLAKLEAAAAPFLKKIIVSGSLPHTSSEAYNQVLTFLLIMSNRTKHGARELEELAEKLFGELQRQGASMANDLLDEVIKNIPLLAFESVMKKITSGNDLKMKLLVNKTKSGFITSDHPVVKYNQYLLAKKHPGGINGLAIKGLQIFFPLSPRHMLCVYDFKIYDVGATSKYVIDLTRQADVDSLNTLQFLNGLDLIYFSDGVDEQYLEKLYSISISKRSNEYSTLKQAGSYVDREDQLHIKYHSFRTQIDAGVEFSFIGQTKKAKKHVLSEHVVQLRDEKIRGKTK